MRLMSDIRKDRLEELEVVRREKENKERLARAAADEEERGRQKASKMKKRKENSTAREERPLTHGAHGVAPQDGSSFGELSILLNYLPCSFHLFGLLVAWLHLGSVFF
jgi:transcriptional adapter 3